MNNERGDSDLKREFKSPQLKYLNLMNKEIQTWFKKYLHFHKGTKRKPNSGLTISQKFIDWVNGLDLTISRKQKFLVILNKINKNNEIFNFTIDNILNTNLSLRDISKKAIKIGISLNPHLIRKIALNSEFNNNLKEFYKRFPRNIITHSVKNRIQEQLREDPPDSLSNIAKSNGVSVKTVIKIALQIFSKNAYQTRWPTTNSKWLKKPSETWDSMLDELFSENPNTLRDISSEIGLSRSFVMRWAKKLFTPEEYHERWPIKNPPISNEIKKIIIEDLSKPNPDTLTIIANKNNVSLSYVRELGKKIFTLEEYRMKWPSSVYKITEEIRCQIIERITEETPDSLTKIAENLNLGVMTLVRIARENYQGNIDIYREKWPEAKDWVSEEVKEQIKFDILNSFDLSQLDIAIKHNVSHTVVNNLALKQIFKDNYKKYRERFPSDDSRISGTLSHSRINDLLTKFFYDEKKVIYISEPRIYPNSLKGADGLILNVKDQKFLEQQFKNNSNLAQQIGINKENLDCIISFQFDYTNNLSTENIVKKILKYEHPNIVLFIIGNNWFFKTETIPLPEDNRIRFPENTKIISPNLLCEFIELNNEYRNQFFEILEYNKTYDIISLYNIPRLSNDELFYTRDLKDFLKEMKLIKKDINEFFMEKGPLDKYIQPNSFNFCNSLGDNSLNLNNHNNNSSCQNKKKKFRNR